MTEYIEKQAARPGEFCVGVSCQECPFLKDPLYGGCRVGDFIMALQPADVKPVVRCKDCRYSREPDRHSLAENAACEGVLICFVGYDHVYPSLSNDVFVDGEHFCGYGEVRDG